MTVIARRQFRASCSFRGCRILGKDARGRQTITAIQAGSLIAKRDELAAKEEATALVPPAEESEGDLIDRASADAEAELQVRLHQTDGRLLKAIEDALMRIRTGKFASVKPASIPFPRRGSKLCRGPGFAEAARSSAALSSNDWAAQLEASQSQINAFA